MLLQEKDAVIQYNDELLQNEKNWKNWKIEILERFNAESAAIGAARGPAPAPAGGPGAADATVTAKSHFKMGQRRYEQRYSDAAQSWGQAAPLKHGASHASYQLGV